VFILQDFLFFLFQLLEWCTVKASNCSLIIHLKHIILDNSDTTSKNIRFLKTPNETVIITDVTACEDILLDQIILNCIR